MNATMRPREWRAQPGTPGSPLIMLCLLSWALLPSIHAQFEVIAAQSAVEAGHTDDCARLHSDALCVPGGAYHFAAAAVVHRTTEQATNWMTPITPDRAPYVRPDPLGALSARAPPTR